MKPTTLAPKKSSALPPIPAPMSPEEMGAGLTVKDRDTLERQVANLLAKAAPGTDVAWRRLTGVLMSLSSNLIKITGLQSILFFIPDGKHRKQVFALHVTDTFQIIAYVPNVLADAIAKKLVAPVKAPEPDLYRLPGGDQMTIQPLDGDTLNPQPQFKGLTGWNRKALAINLPAVFTEAQVQLTEQLAAMSAVSWTS